ncbi:hypothetical protein KM043_009436 [Ampulex compressa]|nr:hypothetical protein KM043_009436 [Ampulex compressa]
MIPYLHVARYTTELSRFRGRNSFRIEETSSSERETGAGISAKEDSWRFEGSQKISLGRENSSVRLPIKFEVAQRFIEFASSSLPFPRTICGRREFCGSQRSVERPSRL